MLGCFSVTLFYKARSTVGAQLSWSTEHSRILVDTSPFGFSTITCLLKCWSQLHKPVPFKQEVRNFIYFSANKKDNHKKHQLCLARY